MENINHHVTNLINRSQQAASSNVPPSTPPSTQTTPVGPSTASSLGTPEQRAARHARLVVTQETAAVAVNRCFALFRNNWPRKFVSIWGDSDSLTASKRCWLNAFRGADFTPAMLDAGLRRVLVESWPPDNPGEFLAMCHVDPSEINAPSVEQAFRVACEAAYPFVDADWHHPAVRHAALEIGLSRLAGFTIADRRIKSKFEQCYRWACDHAAELNPLPAGTLDKKRCVVPDNVTADNFAALKKMLSENTTP